ncbi:MAG: flippase [Candidatus Methanofastidiosia archaeon]|jgi:stage V sporulation protein B
MIKKSILLFSVNTAGRAFQYLYRVIMSHFLTLQQFGVLSAALPYQSFILLFTSMSITPTVSKFTSQYKVDSKEKIFNVFSLLLLGVITGGILYVSAPGIASFFGAEFTDVIYLLKVFSGTVPFAVLLSICTGIFLGFQKARLMAVVLLVYQCIMLFLSYILVQYLGLQGAPLGILFSYIISGCVAVVLVTTFRISRNVSLFDIVKIFRFSLPVLVGVLGLWGLLNVDTLILARFVPAEFVGVYGQAYPTARLVFGFSAALSALLIPKVSELTQKGEDTHASIRRSFEVCALVTVPITVVIAAFSQEILYVLFGNAAGFKSLQILSMGMLVYSLFFVGYSALQGMGHPEYSMGVAAGCAVLNIILCFVLIPRFGIVGAAVSTSISCLIGLISVLVLLKVTFLPRIYYVVVLLPLFVFEKYTGILNTRITTMVIYGLFGIPFLLLYFYLSKKYLRTQE